jgi:hypothetical protein
MHSRLNADSALLYRARRMAKRSRAAAACLPCKTSKSRCSDYRPCARCKKSTALPCMDLPTPKAASNTSIGCLPMMDINEASMCMQSSAVVAPGTIGGAPGSDPGEKTTNGRMVPPLQTATSYTRGAFEWISPAPQFSSAQLDVYSSWTLSTSAYIAAPTAQNRILTHDSTQPSDSSTVFNFPSFSREAARFLQCASGGAPMETAPAELDDQSHAKAAGEQVRRSIRSAHRILRQQRGWSMR